MNVDKELARLMRELQARINPDDLDEVVEAAPAGIAPSTEDGS